MAEANEKLRQQMEEAPAGSFDIERVDGAQRVIEMVSGAALVLLTWRELWSHLCLLLRQDVALVELSGSESECGGGEEVSSSEDESGSDREGLELRLPSNKGRKKVNIQVVGQQGEP